MVKSAVIRIILDIAKTKRAADAALINGSFF
jgi:hypothetical protein